jgi:hypothetical protein
MDPNPGYPGPGQPGHVVGRYAARFQAGLLGLKLFPIKWRYLISAHSQLTQAVEAVTTC